MSGVVIRLANRGDLAKLDLVETSANRAFDGLELKVPELPAPPLEALWVAALSTETLWVADDIHQGVVGVLAAEVIGDDLHIAELDVDFERQREGLGRRLLHTAIDWARARGLSSALLTTYRSIVFNAPFYASLGFAELAPSEAPAWLSAILTAEVERGLEDRCGMRLAL